MVNNKSYHNSKYIEKQRIAKLGSKNPNWKGGITKRRFVNGEYIKGSGKTRMTQEEYLNSNRNPFINIVWRGGTKTKGKKRPDLSIRNKYPNFIKLRMKGLIKRPTSFEKKIIDLIKNYNLPFKYVGNGDFIIESKNPDFIDTNGKKQVIETYYSYFKHTDYEKNRYDIFRKYGYSTLFLTEKDLKDFNWESICLNKINNFMEG